ncbi:T9SS type A sorting domain-containing protein [Chryseobacterium arthrosphaerae]|uniref:T9SS type A sorting domain-containing protein n=1 Tax=Chryseobacterium arthrosphaerae TaxID=651561 RepID=UPI003D345D67
MIKKILFLLSLIPCFINAQSSSNFEDANIYITPPWSGIMTINNFEDSSNNNLRGFNAYDGIKCGSFYGYVTSYLITPLINVTSGVSDHISFWARRRGGNIPGFSLKLSNTTSDIASFTTTLASITPPDDTVFYKYTFDLSPYIGQSIRLALYNSQLGDNRIDIDKVEINGGNLTNCTEPLNPLIFDNITPTSTQLSWSSSSTNDGYEIYYSTNSTPPNINTVPNIIVGPGITSQPLTGLNPGLKYSVYVRSKCGSNYSDWGAVGRFSTYFIPPYSNDFENNPSGELPAGWKNNHMAMPQMYIEDNPLNAHSGSNYLKSAGVNGAASNLNTLPFFLTAGTTYRISIYARKSRQNVKDHTVGIGHSAGNTLFSEPSNLIFLISNPNINYTKYSGLFTPTESRPYYFKINASTMLYDSSLSVSFSNLFLDDFSVEIENSLSTNETSKPKTTISPNPAKDILNINSSNAILEITILTSDARLIKTYKVNSKNTQINVSDLPSGTYFLNLKDTKNTESHKIIKE